MPLPTCIFSFSDATQKPMMRALFTLTFMLLLLSALFLSQPSLAQTAPVVTTEAGPLNYDPSKEITINGTVASVLTKPSPGMLGGSHLLLSTLSGPMDVSLGAFGMRGKGALSVAAGEQIAVTGVVKTFKGTQVFLARMVMAAGQSYAIRNAHGIPITPQARERATENAQNGEAR